MVLPSGPSGTHFKYAMHVKNQPEPICARTNQQHPRFQCNTLGATGNQVIAHEKSSQRGTWAPHGQPGWHVGAAPEHYRCYQIYIPKTQGTRVCDTVEFFPTHCKMPNVSANDAAIYAASNLIKTLTKPQPPDSFLSIGDDQIVALRQLATIFQHSITKKPTSEPGVRDIAPPQCLRTRSQTKQLANAAFTAPQRDRLCHDPPQPPDETKQQVDLDPEPPNDTKIHTKHHIVPVIPNLRPQLTEFRQPLQVQSHLEMPRILVQLGHTQHTSKLAPQTDPKRSPTRSVTRYQDQISVKCTRWTLRMPSFTRAPRAQPSLSNFTRRDSDFGEPTRSRGTTRLERNFPTSPQNKKTKLTHRSLYMSLRTILTPHVN